MNFKKINLLINSYLIYGVIWQKSLIFIFIDGYFVVVKLSKKKSWIKNLFLTDFTEKINC